MSWLFGAVILGLIAGCHTSPRTDLYVDSMAKEIRDLQDQLYEYDHEYRLLEQELESMRRMKDARSIQMDSSTPLQVVPRESVPSKPDQTTKPSNESKPNNSSSSNKSSQPNKAQPEGNATKPDMKSNGGQTPSDTPPSILNTPTQPFQFPSNQPDPLPPPSNKSTTPGQQKTQDSTDLDFNAGDLIVPTITTGSLAPPSIDPAQRSATPDKDLELSLSQIEMPSQLTADRAGAKISTAVQVVTDKRIVEVAFHPALSRSVSFDNDNQDDGLFLVLQPKNEQGQVVAIAGAVMIEVVDPSRDGPTSVIGKWQYSPAEIEGKIQPIGSKQGIHLTLPWNGPNPKADRVIVTATYQMDNGRKVIGKKEIFLNSASVLKTVWTPRASRDKSSTARNFDSSVTTASAESEVGSQTNHGVHSVGPYPAPESAPAPRIMP